MDKHWIILFGYFAFLVNTAIQRPPDACDYSFCNHSSTCTLANGTCVCIKGFEGPNCTLDLNECRSGHVDPCGHRGRCNNTVGSYECDCLSGWSGTHCENPTALNATCIPGYHGATCSETACGNGYPDPDYTVTSSVLSISVCICKDGWNKSKTDAPCNVDIDECMQTPTICSNGGNCTNTNGSYHCECTEHWEGINCSDYVTTTTEAITTVQTTETFTNETITARQLTSTVLFATDPKDQNTKKPTVQTITEYEQLKSTRAIYTEQTIISLTQQTTNAAMTETPQNIAEPTTTVIYVKHPINQNTIEHTEETTTDHPQLKSTKAISTEQTTSTLTWQTTQLAKAETPQDITELTTTVLNVTDPTNQNIKEPSEQTKPEHEQLKWTGAISTEQTAINLTQQTTVEYTEETTTDHRHTSAPDLLSTQTSGNNNTTADYSSSVTDPASTEAQRRPFLSNWTTLELTTGPSLTRLLSDSENEQKDKLKAWMISLIAVVVVLACVLIAALLLLKYYTVANKKIRKRMTNKVDVSLASMENNWNFKANERMQRGSISGV